MKQTDDRLVLTDIERNSALWQKIKAHYDRRLRTLRARNDDPKSESETALLRGRIHEVKALLAIDAIPMTTPKE